MVGASRGLLSLDLVFLEVDARFVQRAGPTSAAAAARSFAREVRR